MIVDTRQQKQNFGKILIIGNLEIWSERTGASFRAIFIFQAMSNFCCHYIDQSQQNY